MSPKIPALLDTYGLVNGVPNTDADDMFTMRPAPDALRCGHAARLTRTAPP